MVTEKYITIDNSTIYYQVTGKGNPVVLVHGFGEDSGIWNASVDFLKTSFRLIVPDLPGSGKSELLLKENTAMGDYARCIYLIIMQEKISQCIMIGHSMGGYITLAFAKQYPEILKAFVLFHSSAYADDPEKIETRKKGISFIEANGAQAFLKTSIPGLFYDAHESDKYIKELIIKAEKFSAEALIQYYQAMIARPDSISLLEDFAGTVLFIVGMHDRAILYQHSLQQSHLPKQPYIYVLRKSAHMGMLEEPEKSNKSLYEMLHNI
ncbi:MAG: alpha/beta hydrolase [Ferruginibacter sp.]